MPITYEKTEDKNIVKRIETNETSIDVEELQKRLAALKDELAATILIEKSADSNPDIDDLINNENFLRNNRRMEAEKEIGQLEEVINQISKL